MYNNNTRAQWNYYILSIMLILFLATSSIFGANSKFNFINDKTRTSFEFMTVDNLIVIQAEINGIPVNLVLDTGVRSIVLFGRKFDSQFETIDNYTVAMSGYGKVKSRSGKLSMDNDILIADVLGSSVCVVLMPGGNLFEQAGLPHIDGIIGYQLFSRFIVKIDYKYRRISMYEPFVDLDLSSYESVPLIIKDTKPYVKASVATMGGHVETGFFHLDTGSSQDMLLFMREKKVATPKSMHRTLLGIGIGGKVRGFRGKEAYTLQIGERFKKKIIPKYVQRGFSNREIQDAYGSIGSGMLKDSVIIIDYLRQRFYFI